MTEQTRPEGLDAEETEAANVIPTTYVGVKRVEAWPQDKEAVPTAQDPLAQHPRRGYAVRYPDGYTSWSPAAVFEEAYHPVPPAEADERVNAAKGAICGVIPGVTNEAAEAPLPSNGPRVSLFGIERKVAAEYAFTLDAALGEGVPLHPRLGVVTVAVLVMENGMVITESSAPVSDDNFNEELGRRFAREKAIRQAQGYEAYLLRQRLFCQAQAAEALADTTGQAREQLGTDAWLWAGAFTHMLTTKGAFPNDEAQAEFGDIALGWFADAIERARHEGLTQNPSFDPDAPETPDFAAILTKLLGDYGLEDVAGEVKAGTSTSFAVDMVLEAMGAAYAKGLARTTFPSRQSDEMAAGVIHEPGTNGLTPGLGDGRTTPLYQISGPDLDTIQRVLEAVSQSLPLEEDEASSCLKIIAEAIAERDGGNMVGGALCDDGRLEGADDDASTGTGGQTLAEIGLKEAVESARSALQEDEAGIILQGGGLVEGAAAAGESFRTLEDELKERPQEPAPEAVHHREQHPDGPVRGFEIGQGFVRGSEDDPAS